MNENKDIEKLLIRLSKVSMNITKSVNFSGYITKKQIKEQEIVVNKLSKKLGLDKDYLMEQLYD